MDIKMNVDAKIGVEVVVRIPMDQYMKAVASVPILDQEANGENVQRCNGLEHSGKDFLFRLARMNEFLEKK